MIIEFVQTLNALEKPSGNAPGMLRTNRVFFYLTCDVQTAGKQNLGLAVNRDSLAYDVVQNPACPDTIPLCLVTDVFSSPNNDDDLLPEIQLSFADRDKAFIFFPSRSDRDACAKIIKSRSPNLAVSALAPAPSSSLKTVPRPQLRRQLDAKIRIGVSPSLSISKKNSPVVRPTVRPTLEQHLTVSKSPVVANASTAAAPEITASAAGNQDDDPAAATSKPPGTIAAIIAIAEIEDGSGLDGERRPGLDTGMSQCWSSTKRPLQQSPAKSSFVPNEEDTEELDLDETQDIDLDETQDIDPDETQEPQMPNQDVDAEQSKLQRITKTSSIGLVAKRGKRQAWQDDLSDDEDDVKLKQVASNPKLRDASSMEPPSEVEQKPAADACPATAPFTEAESLTQPSAPSLSLTPSQEATSSEMTNRGQTSEAPPVATVDEDDDGQILSENALEDALEKIKTMTMAQMKGAGRRGAFKRP
jgi:hypothetical protein